MRRCLHGRIPFLLAGLLLALAFHQRVRAAVGPEQVVVIVNDASPISVAIGDYYQASRGIPVTNICHLPIGTPTGEGISRATFNAFVRDPIADFLVQNGLRDSALYLVHTKGVPLRIFNEIGGGTGADGACVDSELTLLFTGSLGDTGQQGWLPNRYYGSEKAFDRFIADGGTGIKYLVCRLDGYQTNVDPGTGVPIDIKNLIDRGAVPAAAGAFLLDADPTKGGGYTVGNVWMDLAATTLVRYGETVIHDTTTAFVSGVPDILGYASWGSNDCCTAGPPYYGEIPPGSGNVYPGTFAVGALTTDYVSTSGRTFTDGNQNYGQSLVADLIRNGATGCNGHVAEPFLDAVSRPQYLLPRFAMGYQAAEAFYSSIPYVSWMNVIVVDPLARRADYGPPAIQTIDPPSGSILGSDTVTITGTEFRGQVEVLFGGIPSVVVTRTRPTMVRALVPPGPHDGQVDVTVRTTFGETTLASGFTYTPQPVALQLLDPPELGTTIHFKVTGPSLAPFALLTDRSIGTTCRANGAICVDLAFTTSLRVLHNGITGPGAPLDPIGDGFVDFTIPPNNRFVGRTFYTQAVVETQASPPRAFQTTNLVPATIFQ